MTTKTSYTLGVIVIIILIGLIGYTVTRTAHSPTITPDAPEPIVETPEPTVATSSITTIGYSVEKRPITAHHFGNGSTSLLFVGGIHGGYEWNSSALAYEFINAFTSGQVTPPQNITVTIIPTLNPDGLFTATGIIGAFTPDMVPDTDTHQTGNGRFNSNGVDLNRNFDCKWQPESSWRNQKVSAGSAPFSEPEAMALKQLVELTSPAAVVFWHSQANAVYGSECHDGVLPETLAVLTSYSDAAGYTAIPRFDAYPVTGDAEGWLATLSIPAITVELGTRTTTEWEKNRAGVIALLSKYAK
jgi:predicted deacylase